MKNPVIVLGTLAFIGAVTFFVMGCTGNAGNNAGGNHNQANGGLKIAYVNIDSFEANFEYLKAKRDEFQRKQENIRQELQRSEQQLQNDVVSLQRRAQAGTLTQAEGQAAEKRLMQMQQSLETRKESLTQQLMQEQDEFNEGLHNKLDSFLTDYNEEKGYDYILTYGRASQVMYAKKAHDITKEILKGMNDRYKAETEELNKSK